MKDTEPLPQHAPFGAIIVENWTENPFKVCAIINALISFFLILIVVHSTCLFINTLVSGVHCPIWPVFLCSACFVCSRVALRAIYRHDVALMYYWPRGLCLLAASHGHSFKKSLLQLMHMCGWYFACYHSVMKHTHCVEALGCHLCRCQLASFCFLLLLSRLPYASFQCLEVKKTTQSHAFGSTGGFPRATSTTTKISVLITWPCMGCCCRDALCIY